MTYALLGYLLTFQSRNILLLIVVLNLESQYLLQRSGKAASSQEYHMSSRAKLLEPSTVSNMVNLNTKLCQRELVWSRRPEEGVLRFRFVYAEQSK